MNEAANAHGRYFVRCYRPDGSLRWSAIAENVVTTVGKDLALDSYLSGAAYTVNGPFLGLISSVSFVGVAATDTMAVHPGWTEAGLANAPTYGPTRPTSVFAPAAGGSKTTAPATVFSISSTGTIKGAFLVFGPGAVSTIDSPLGTLYSAGLFTGGNQPVDNGDTLNVTYTASL